MTFKLKNNGNAGALPVVRGDPALSKPAPRNGNGESDDAKLFESIAHLGVDRVLNIAARVDQAQRQNQQSK